MSISRRLDKLNKHYPRPPESHDFDISGLTSREAFELGELLEKLSDAPILPDGQLDLSPLSDTEQERLGTLWQAITWFERT